jgi:aryl-alcohol dehydrogenase-like predicted oxidoreductase
MQLRPLGRSGLWVGRLGLGTGTWTRGTDEYEARDQLAAFLDAGGTLLDTADVYADGDAEALLGELVEEFEVRDQVVIATKAGAVDGPDRRMNASRQHLLRALEASLRRLRTETVDLWQLHAWDPWTPMDETLAAVDDAVSSGKARYAGISNYSGWQMSRAATWQQAVPGRTPLVTAQMEYSLLERGIEREIVPAAQSAGMGILPWSPLGRGVLTG